MLPVATRSGEVCTIFAILRSRSRIEANARVGVLLPENVPFEPGESADERSVIAREDRYANLWAVPKNSFLS